jgi:hypothetical protein
MLTATAICRCHQKEMGRVFRSFLQESFHAKRRRKPMRRAIREYMDSPSFTILTVTGSDYNNLYSLLQVFSPFFFNASPYSVDKEQ